MATEHLRSRGNLPGSGADPVRRIANQFKGQLGVSITAALVNGLDQAVNKKIPQFGNAMGVALSKNLQAARRLETNKKLAEEARLAVVAAYDSRHRLYTPQGEPDPRAVGRYGPGVLADELATGPMTEGTTRDRISFINMEHLRQTAPHFARLNWGAGGNQSSAGAGAQPGSFELSFVGPQGGRQTVGALSFGTGHVQPMMKIPKHNWDEHGFFHVARVPTGGEREWLRAGARGAQFFDEGLKWIALHAGEEYLIMFNEALRDPKTQKAVEGHIGHTIRAVDLTGIA